jgi:leucyl aminopeptidase (aminopeptidase T)
MTTWTTVAQRIVRGLDVQPGELIQVRDYAGRIEALQEVLLAIELAGATPLVQMAPPGYMERLWAGAPHDYLVNWDRHRQQWASQADRTLVLGGPNRQITGVEEAMALWAAAVDRLTRLEEQRCLPYLLAAVPTEHWAQQSGLTLADLDARLLPTLAVSADGLQQHIRPVLSAASEGQQITIQSGAGYILHLSQGDRRWLSDDGHIDAQDRTTGAIVSNLPGGSIYTTVIETQTYGSLWLPIADEATDVVLHFQNGRIVSIEAASGAVSLVALLDRQTGEPRRISHIGVGLNPELRQPLGWTLVDEHVYGSLFVALGENRYMGGQNESSLNIDFSVPSATLLVGGRAIVRDGSIVV